MSLTPGKMFNGRLKSGIAYYDTVQYLSSPHFLLRNTKMKINRTKILPNILFGFETFVSHTEGRTKADGVQEEGAAEDTWG